jgi:CO/xanthine dehydrogenase Mo-binding subunit
MTAITGVEKAVGVGISRPRVDAASKVTGESGFAADLQLHGLLHARLVLSSYAHARILGIDKTAALEVPGVCAVLTADDLPIKGEGGRTNEPLARSEVLFAGQPVALVVAESEAAAEDGVERVLVDYEPLTAVVDLEAAIALGAPPARLADVVDASDAEAHGAIGDASSSGAAGLSENVSGDFLFSEGDTDAVFADCAAVVEGRFTTSWVHQTYLEPQVAVAWPEGPDAIGIYTSTQGVFLTREIVSNVYGIPPSKVRVQAATLGGGFGGKLGLVEPLVVGAMLALKRPVRLAFTRSEDFAAGNPAPGFLIDLKVGARADGTFAALECRALVDGGAFADMAPTALVGGRVGGPYRWEAWNVQTFGVRTNRFGPGAYRAPTATPIAFALEPLLDELAEKLGIDPLELRRLNAPEEGDRRFDGSPWPRIGLRETLTALEDHPLWRGRGTLPPNEGVGLAAGLFPGGKMGAGAVCRLDNDGGLTILTGYVDMSGTDTTIATIAAETFGVDVNLVRIVAADSSAAPQSGVSGGSMVTYCLGSAVQEAAVDAREQLLRIVSGQLDVDPSDLEIADGEVRPRGVPDRGLTIAGIATKLNGFGSASPPVEGHAIVVPPELAPSAAAALVHVRVDPETGKTEVLGYVAAQDVGRALNPALCDGQLRGGAVQSIGYALYEELAHDAEGNLKSGSFLNYAIPKFESVPQIETILVEVPSEHGPLGARGIGESAIVPGAAAIANAISAATGRRPRHMPMTPERLWRLLDETP